MDTEINKCEGCCNNVSPSDVTECTNCEKCHAIYHKACMNISDKEDELSNSRCPESKQDSGNENKTYETPIEMTQSDKLICDKDSLQALAKESTPHEPKLEPESESTDPHEGHFQGNQFHFLIEEVKALRSDLSTFKREMEFEMAAIKLSVHTCISCIESLEHRFFKVENKTSVPYLNVAEAVEDIVESPRCDFNNEDQESEAKSIAGSDIPELNELSNSAESHLGVLASAASKPERGLVLVRPYTTTDYKMEQTIEQYVGKKYKLKSSENFEEYMKFIGVGLLSRKTAAAVSPISVLTREGDLYTFTMMTTFRTIAFSFKFNEEFDEERPDGCIVKSKVVADGNVLIHTQTEPDGRKSVHKRTFTPDTLTVETTAEGWDLTCRRIYEAVP